MSDGQSPEDELAILDRVLVEADIDDHSVSFRAVVVRICQTELWLGLASPDPHLETMPADGEVRLTFSRNGAALQSRSRFLRGLDGSRTRVFAVAWPGVLEPVQRRAYVRYTFDWPIAFRRLDPATREPQGKAASGMTLNVSAGGLLFESETPVHVDEELELTLPLSGGAGVKVHGVVVRVRGADEGDSNHEDKADRTEAAVKFTRITAPDQERIVRFILLTKHRREAELHPLSVPVAEGAAAPPLAPTGDDR